MVNDQWLMVNDQWAIETCRAKREWKLEYKCETKFFRKKKSDWFSIGLF